MGELQKAIENLERKVEAIKHEADRTSFPHILKAGIDSASTVLNQAVVLSQIGRGEERARMMLKQEVQL